MPERVTTLDTSAGPLEVTDIDGWIYVEPKQYRAHVGELLLDFECTADPNVSRFVDGNPRLVIHAPFGGDAVLFIRFQPDGSLILNTESDVEIEQVKGAEHTWHVRDRRIHSTYQPKESTSE